MISKWFHNGHTRSHEKLSFCSRLQLYCFFCVHGDSFLFEYRLVELSVTVGTQAAVLAGLDITMFIEFNPPHNDEWVSNM